MPVVEFAERRVDGEVELSLLHRPGEPVVLFLHGLAGYGGEWLGVVSELSETFGLLIPDQRGHGASRTGGGVELGRADYVNDAVELIEELASDGSVIVVGQSMGGIVGTYLTRERPDLVAALVLIETGMEPVTDDQINNLETWFDSWSRGFESVTEAGEFFGEGTPSAEVWVDGLEWRNGRLVGRFDPKPNGRSDAKPCIRISVD